MIISFDAQCTFTKIDLECACVVADNFIPIKLTHRGDREAQGLGYSPHLRTVPGNLDFYLEHCLVDCRECTALARHYPACLTLVPVKINEGKAGIKFIPSNSYSLGMVVFIMSYRILSCNHLLCNLCCIKRNVHYLLACRNRGKRNAKS